MPFKIKFKASITTVMAFMVILVGSSISGLFLVVSSDISREIAEETFESKTAHAASSLREIIHSTSSSTSIGASQFGIKLGPENTLNSVQLPVILETLKQNPAFYSIYYGFEDDSFFQVIAVRGNKNILTRHQAPDGTAWIVRTINKTPDRREQWRYLDNELEELGTLTNDNPSYYPTKRPWYFSAIAAGKVVLSDPYWFHSLNQLGLTLSQKTAGREGVYGVDLTLSELSKKLASIQVSKNGVLALYDKDNRILAMSPKPEQLTELSTLDKIKSHNLNIFYNSVDTLTSGEIGTVQYENKGYFLQRDVISFNGTQYYLGTLAPITDFSDVFDSFYEYIFMVCVLGLCIFLPFAFLFSASLAQKVTELASAAESVSKLDFNVHNLKESMIVEFDNLIRSFSEMSINLREKTNALQIEQEKLSRLVDLGISVSSEKSTDKLMEEVLSGAKDLTHAEGCTLYLLNDEQCLDFKIFKNDTLNMTFNDANTALKNLPSIPLYDAEGEPNLNNIVGYAVHKEEIVNIDDVYNSESFDFSGPKAFDAKHNYTTQSILTVPLKPRGGKVIGALQVINAKNTDTDAIIAFSEEIQPYVEAVAAQASTALYNRHLLESQEKLMDSLIHLIAGAIDAKSPYTGAHCARVPALATMLAKQASEGQQGSYKDFAFTTESEWREFEVGAWLHDCGKVITPEYVVDKATKLETIYNRIHEIRTRFEVLLRDAKISELESIVSGGDKALAEKTYQDRKQQLLDNFAFIAECNIGGEFMSEESIERLNQIATTEWQRNFNIHLGLSHIEASRYANEPEGPCTEKLLDDKDFHIIPRVKEVNELYAGLGFKLEVPENLYNQGELHNLSVKRGTLSDEERFKVNEHIMQTIVMLEQLPLPDHLKRIPEYAGTHHETMIGTGYPRKLSGDELSVPARIMAIADIFEALTASDRPYKKAKTLSEAVKILSFFKNDQHIDGDLFDLFLTSGVYLQYAEKFLSPEQIDDVDVAQYLS